MLDFRIFLRMHLSLNTCCRFSMQDCLRYLVEESLESYTEMISDACIGVMGCEADMKWPCEDVIKSPYSPKKNAIFLIDLAFEDSQMKFSTDPSVFLESCVNLFNKGVECTKKIPQLEKMVRLAVRNNVYGYQYCFMFYGL